MTRRPTDILYDIRCQNAAQVYSHGAPHTPFRRLESVPLNYTPQDQELFGYPIANDELAHQYLGTIGRTRTEEFLTAKQRVAIVIGEAALVAAMPFITEETVLVADNSPCMLWFMARYRDNLRTSRSATDWLGSTGEALARYDYRREPGALKGLFADQIGNWEAAGSTHPINNSQHFKSSQEAARNKAIVPYHIDVGDELSMKRLGNLLRKCQAIVTLIDHTNVVQFDPRDSELLVRPLAHLPIMPDAPIFASALDINRRPENFGLDLLGTLGPFKGLRAYGEAFGISNLTVKTT